MYLECIRMLELDTCDLFEYFKPEELSHDLILEIARSIKRSLKKIPLDQQDFPIRVAALQTDPDSLQDIPYEERTQELCFIAKDLKESTLKYVPSKHLSEDECWNFSKRYRGKIGNIPCEFRNPGMMAAHAAFKQSNMRYVPKSERTYLFAQQMVDRHANCYPHFPEHLRDTALSYTALKPYSDNVGHVPPDVLDEEYCYLLVTITPSLLRNIPQQFRTPKVLQAAVNQNPAVIRSLHDTEITQPLADLAVTRNPRSLEDIPRKFKTYTMCRQVVRQAENMLFWVPKKYRDPDLCLDSARTGLKTLCHVPEPLRSEEICYLCVVADSSNIRDVPDASKSQRCCLAAVRQNVAHIQHVPDAFITLELCESFTPPTYAKYSEYIPEHLREAVKNAVDEQNFKMLEFLHSFPDESQTRYPLSSETEYTMT